MPGKGYPTRQEKRRYPHQTQERQILFDIMEKLEAFYQAVALFEESRRSIYPSDFNRKFMSCTVFIFNEIANKFRTDEFSIGEVAINFFHPE